MSPRRVHWKGHTYPSIGWALGDILLAFPFIAAVHGRVQVHHGGDGEFPQHRDSH